MSNTHDLQNFRLTMWHFIYTHVGCNITDEYKTNTTSLGQGSVGFEATRNKKPEPSTCCKIANVNERGLQTRSLVT
jgi:hypothetical protein